jgi:hypothetical protein
MNSCSEGANLEFDTVDRQGFEVDRLVGQ